MSSAMQVSPNFTVRAERPGDLYCSVFIPEPPLWPTCGGLQPEQSSAATHRLLDPNAAPARHAPPPPWEQTPVVA